MPIIAILYDQPDLYYIPPPTLIVSAIEAIFRLQLPYYSVFLVVAPRREFAPYSAYILRTGTLHRRRPFFSRRSTPNISMEENQLYVVLENGLEHETKNDSKLAILILEFQFLVQVRVREIY
ncbi:hypothetical protein BJ912DRAFT_925744 [Pholiota molesta]|nr:hypothetical protein BJ912DRAFT_925744 [Pholiota molesta]